MRYDLIEKVEVHRATGTRGTLRTQQIDVYFNFIGNFVPPVTEEEIKAKEEATRKAEEERRQRKNEIV